MIGFMYRGAVALKEFGKRHHLVWLVNLGLAIREWVIKFPVRHFQ
jgi:hypothetical protein